MTPEAFKTFALAGNATFTVTSQKTGTRFTFKLRAPVTQTDPTSPVIHAMVLTGPDNEEDYEYVGTMFLRDARYSAGAKARIKPDAPSSKAARWVCERLMANLPLKDCEVHHEGRCGRCGRKLTVPESIETGIGPECALKL